ncbi:MAG: hypothetical protein ABR552_05740 [Actinomycetota bacterium]
MSEKPLLDKLGVKPGHRVSVLYIDDASFLSSIRRRADVSKKRREGSDIILLGAERATDLERIAKVKPDLVKDGALWVVRPKGVKAITEADVMQAGSAAGLVDVKVVSFSATHTAEKFVYRLKDR